MKNKHLYAAARVIAVVFSRLGPYHLARLRGAAEVLARENIRLATIAIAGMDRVYAWDRVDTEMADQTRVLFPNEQYEDISTARMARGLQDALDDINPLTVALPGWAFSEARAGLAWCQRRKRPAILMSESTRNDHVRLWPRELLKQTLVRRFASALVGGSRHRQYARQLGLPRAAIFTGYDVVDNDYFQHAADNIRRSDEAERQARHLPKRYLLTSSRFVAQKNLEGLLRGYARYVATSPTSRDLVLCGDGAYRERLHGLARTLQVEDRIHWSGFVQYPDLPAFYALADAFILASTTEPWGLVVNEAMASGLPVLVSNHCGCSPDLVRDGENGFTFDPTSVEAIAEAMSKLPDDAAALNLMGANSRQIIGGYTIQAFGEGLLDAARLAVARKGGTELALPSGPL
jgi:glycosyltransferase involved in cell wall biosynthesis